MKRKVYIDNSVFGGVFDSEFSEHSELLFEEFKRGIFIPVVSNITINESTNAPDNVKQLFEEIYDLSEVISTNEEVLSLSGEYIKEGNFSQRMEADTLHIALASVYKIDILVSWNFRDIVNLNKIRIYNGVNIKLGYPIIEIRSPREVLHE